MNYQQQCQHYKRMQVETAPPERLVSMLYDGAIKSIDQAAAALNRGDHETAHARLVRVQAIVTELRCSLNPAAGQIASSLSSLYGFTHDCLVQANLSKSSEPLLLAHSMLTELKEAWDGATTTATNGKSREAIQ